LRNDPMSKRNAVPVRFTPRLQREESARRQALERFAPLASRGAWTLSVPPIAHRAFASRFRTRFMDSKCDAESH
jgi:hypothetical protein